MKVVVNRGAGFDPDVNLNPRGLCANSGVGQWLNETLVTIEQTTNGKYRVIELPVHSVEVIDRKFATCTITDSEYSDIMRVQFSYCIVYHEPNK